MLTLMTVAFDQAFPQNDTRPKVSNNDKALFYFIEGKTLELKNNYIGAIENYREALKYDKAAGIHHALAIAFLKVGKVSEALIETNNALKIAPTNESYLETLANLHILKKNFKEAVNTYERIIQLDSNYTYGLYSLARLYQEMKQPAKAIEIYEKITSKIGYDYDVLNKMYDIYINYRDYNKAAEVLVALLQLDPYNTSIKKILATLYSRTENIDGARKVYEELYMLNPDDKEVQTELVKIYFKQNENDKAFENFSKMLGKDSLGFWEKVQVGELYYNLIPQDASAKDIAQNIFIQLNNDYPLSWVPYYYLGVIDVLDQNGSEYIDKFEKAIAHADTSREVFINIGLTYYQQNEIEPALKVIDEGISKFPDEARLYYVKGLTLQRGGREKDAIVSYEEAMALNNQDLNILSALALAYDNQGMFDKSTQTYEKALLVDPQNPLILNNYAYNLSERGESLDKALSMSKVAVEKDPENASYLDTIGWIYFKLKNYKLAKENIEKSLQINPNSAVVLEHLGDVYGAMKDGKNAMKYWKLSLEKNPANSGLKDKIAYYTEG